MAVKTLSEAIIRAVDIHTTHGGPQNSTIGSMQELFDKRLKGELRDYAAHVVMRLESEWLHTPFINDHDREVMGIAARRLFNEMFQGIPAFQTKKEGE